MYNYVVLSNCILMMYDYTGGSFRGELYSIQSWAVIHCKYATTASGIRMVIVFKPEINLNVIDLLLPGQVVFY